MKILPPPLAEYVQQLFIRAEEIYIVSPWIKYVTTKWLLTPNTHISYRNVHVLLSGNFSDFINKSSDIEAIEWLLNRGADIRSILNLHAKIYLADETQAILTSANLTASGFGFSSGNANVEIGILIDDSESVVSLKSIVRNWFSESHVINQEWLDQLKQSFRLTIAQDAKQKIQEGEDELRQFSKQLTNTRFHIKKYSHKKKSTHYRQINIPEDDWIEGVKLWIQQHKSMPSDLQDEYVMFFKKAFEHTRHPERAWFGIHPSIISLVVG